jgi:hypothetical protein
MTQPAGQPPDPPAGGQGGAQQPSDSERIRQLEARQATVDGKLDTILDRLKPGDGGGDPVTQPGPAPAPAADIGEQMREAVRAVAAEQAAQQPTAPPQEIPPREIGIRGKARLQGRLFGRDPS